jgi:uncharacterized delta-60 repeat protein
MKTKVFTIYLVILSYSITLYGQQGSLDLSFDVDGKQTTNFGGTDHGKSVAIQADGKIVVAGDAKEPYGGSHFKFAIVRYNPDGSHDNSFGNGGILTTSFGGESDGASSVAIQSDGKIVVAGSTENINYYFALARYNFDGSPDTTFGNGGKLTTTFGGDNDWATSVAIQSDGKIVVAGNSSIGTDSDFALARYNPDGSLDNSFGTNGKLTTDFGGHDDHGYSVALQEDGKIVVAGTSSNSTEINFALARYNFDGSPDNTFGTNGKLITNFGGNASGRSMAIQEDGKIVVVGNSSNGTEYDFALSRYNIDGSPDNSFGLNGRLTSDFGDDNFGESVVLDAAEKIIVAGTSSNETNNSFTLAQYNPDGSLDSTFGTNGLVTTDFNGYVNSVGMSVALQEDGKIIVAGQSYDTNGTDFAVARYLSDLNIGFVDMIVQSNLTLIYPNPIGKSATLEYTLARDEVLSIDLYDVSGKIIASLITSESRAKGKHKEIINFNESIPAGNYLLTIRNQSANLTIKIMKR